MVLCPEDKRILMKKLKKRKNEKRKKTIAELEAAMGYEKENKEQTTKRTDRVMLTLAEDE